MVNFCERFFFFLFFVENGVEQIYSFLRYCWPYANIEGKRNSELWVKYSQPSEGTCTLGSASANNSMKQRGQSRPYPFPLISDSNTAKRENERKFFKFFHKPKWSDSYRFFLQRLFNIIGGIFYEIVKTARDYRNCSIIFFIRRHKFRNFDLSFFFLLGIIKRTKNELKRMETDYPINRDDWTVWTTYYEMHLVSKIHRIFLYCTKRVGGGNSWVESYVISAPWHQRKSLQNKCCCFFYYYFYRY